MSLLPKRRETNWGGRRRRNGKPAICGGHHRQGVGGRGVVAGIGKNSGECSSESKENAKNRGAKAKQTSGVPRIDSSGTNCHTTLVPRQTSLLRYKVYILDTRKWKSPAIYQAKARRHQGFAGDSQIGFYLIPGFQLKYYKHLLCSPVT